MVSTQATLFLPHVAIGFGTNGLNAPGKALCQHRRICQTHRLKMQSDSNGSPELESPKKMSVETSTGFRRARQGNSTYSSALTEIVRGDIQLPDNPIEVVGDLVPDRKNAAAVVYGLPDYFQRDDWLRDAAVVIFGHGFSQRPANYASTLSRIAVLGYIVIAPRVWIFDILGEWMSAGLFNVLTQMPQRLQNALLIDIARTVQMVQRCGARQVHLVGHSMGGALALAYGRYVPPTGLQSMTMLAPAVKASVETTLNPIFNGKNMDNITKDDVPPVPMLFLQGSRDIIVHRRDTKKIYEEIKAKQEPTGYAKLQGGTHIGFEDKLTVDVPILVILDQLFFLFLDFLIFRADFLCIDTKEQLETTKSLLEAFLRAVDDKEDIESAVQNSFVEETVELSWSNGTQTIVPTSEETVDIINR